MLQFAPPEVFFAVGYALFLMIVAGVLERLGLQAHHRSQQYELGGFKFQHDADRWECPQGHYLHRSVTDHDRRVIRYKAPAHTCNACRMKPQCTDSQNGREIEREIGSWIETELGRFHRGISLTLLLLAGLLLLIEAARYHQPRADLVLGAPVVLLVMSAARRLRAFSKPLR
jgi:hypothetical protein